jgi:hypothetical protein
MSRRRERHREAIHAATTAARAAAHEVWHEEVIHTDEVLGSAVAASARLIGGRATSSILPDLTLEPVCTHAEPTWSGLLYPEWTDEEWDWIIEVVPTIGDECPRLWRRLGFSLTIGVLTGTDDRGDQVTWSRLYHSGDDRHFYYWSGGCQDGITQLFNVTPATRSGRANALLDILDWTCANYDPTHLSARVDAATFRRLERRALDSHGIRLVHAEQPH